MIKSLHPTLKACACGFISTKNELLRHFDMGSKHYKTCGFTSKEYWTKHGEVPLNEDDPRLSHLERNLSRLERIDTL